MRSMRYHIAADEQVREQAKEVAIHSVREVCGGSKMMGRKNQRVKVKTTVERKGTKCVGSKASDYKEWFMEIYEV